MRDSYKALITDLDGSAVAISSNGDDITEETKLAVKKSIEVGKMIACATGRGWIYTKPVVRELGLIQPCIIEGGTRIIDPVSEKTLWERGFSDESAHFIKEKFVEYAPYGLFITSGRDSINDGGDISGTAQKEKFVQAKDSDEPLVDLRYLYLLGVKHDNAVELVNAINVSDEVIAHITPSWQGDDLHDVHVTSRAATKEHAIDEWSKMMNVAKTEIIGFGDSGNDLPIFEAVGLRIGSATGTDEILEVADHIAPGPQEEGLRYIIEKFLVA